MSLKRKITCVVLTILTLMTLAFIISNSIKPAEQSVEQSDAVTDVIQGVVDTVVPSNPPKVSSSLVRKLAHFSEFALLGFFALLTYCAYTDKKIFVFLVPVFTLLSAICDEIVQNFSDGRGPEALDVLIDFGGAITGILVALGVFVLFKKFYLDRRGQEKV